MPRVQKASPRAIGIGVLLAGTYVFLLAAIFLVSRRSVVRPVLLETRDVLLGPEDPIELAVRAVDGSSGEPAADVPLGFRACRDSKEIGTRSAITASSGVASASFPPAAKWEEPRQPAGDFECLISGEDPSRFFLDSPWREPGGNARHAVLDVLAVERGTEFLLVCLDGIWSEGSAERLEEPRHRPPPEFLEAVRTRSRLHHRTIYLAAGKDVFAQSRKFWLMTSGFPAGMLLQRDGREQREAWLRELSLRIESLGAKVAGIVCQREEEKSTLQIAFPSASVEVVLQELPR